MTSDSFSGRDINETILPSQDDCIPSILLNSLFLLPKMIDSVQLSILISMFLQF